MSDVGNQIIKQPNGLFAIFSSNTDTITVWDATAQEIEDHFVELAVSQERRAVRRLVGLVEGGHARDAYHQFAMTWDEALRKDEDHGGDAWHEAKR